MKKYDIKSVNLEFKNLLSGPAPVGRILNYIYLIGTKGLKHKNGNRQTNLNNNIGDAWCTEFMLGLGLVRLGNIVGTAYKLELTNNGMLLFGYMKDKDFDFDEGVYNSNILNVLSQIKKCHPNLYQEFKNIFVNTYPFLILKDYLKEKGYSFDSSDSFNKDFFEAVADLYGEQAREAGFNRVPSLIQLCKLFGFAELRSGVHFNKATFENLDSDIAVYEFIESSLIEEAEKIQKLYEFGADIAEKYGEDGTVFVSGLARNSELQKKFKNNLSVEQEHKCVICGLKTEKLLIGSHIKPSADCNVFEKADTQNGLLLCANHDKLFDRYLISFNPQNGKITINEKPIKDEYPFLKLEANFVLPDHLLTDKRKKYLENHYQEFLKRKDK
ncbi:MAG: HNH endonuclease [Clostridia bacterium]|nr:HNH endonuclease [Clostridia bacterium]